MNAISAQDIKRRGVLALQEAAKDGTVHILKHNRPVGVFLSEDAYRALITAQSKPSDSLLDWMLKKPATGQETAESIHARLHQERETWD